MTDKDKENRGWFKKGHDPRRHQFTAEELARGGRAAFLVVAFNKPEKVLWLQKRIKASATTRAKVGFRRRRRLYARGVLEGSGY